MAPPPQPRRNFPLPRLPRVEGPAEVRGRTWVQLVRTFYRMQRRFEQSLGDHGVTLPQFDVIATLSFGEGITQQELAERLLVTKGNVCGLLDRLEAMGWVERRPDAIDRRANRLYLTTAGRAKLARLMPEQNALIHQLTQPLADAQIKTLRLLLETLEAGLDEN